MKPALIHFEHGLPALAALGIETLFPLLGGQGFSTDDLGKALSGLAGGAEKRAARLLVAVAKATPAELLAWEADPDAQARAVRDAALVSIEEAKAVVMDFFDSLGLSQGSIRASSVEGTNPAPPDPAPAPAP